MLFLCDFCYFNPFFLLFSWKHRSMLQKWPRYRWLHQESRYWTQTTSRYRQNFQSLFRATIGTAVPWYHPDESWHWIQSCFHKLTGAWSQQIWNRENQVSELLKDKNLNFRIVFFCVTHITDELCNSSLNVCLSPFEVRYGWGSITFKKIYTIFFSSSFKEREELWS